VNNLAHREAGSGPALVLLHAFPLDGRMWQRQLETFAAEYRVIAPDTFGFGESPLPAGDWTMDSMAEALAGLLDDLEIREPVILGGLSMGGYIALAFAKRYPERLRGLILADTRADADTPEARATRDETIAFVEKNSTAAQFEKMLPKMLSTTEPDAAEFARGLAAGQSVAATAAALKTLRDRPDSTSALEVFDFPTLVIVGADDAITPPKLAEAMVKELKRPTLEVISNAGHLSNLDGTAAFDDAVRRWLSAL
jgi:3-oxoadipate enol-lactonase